MIYVDEGRWQVIEPMNRILSVQYSGSAEVSAAVRSIVLPEMTMNPFNTIGKRRDSEWQLVPASEKEIDALRRKCKRLVTRRAAVSAGISVMPIPGLDLAVDLGLLMRLINEINAEFGLTPEQIDRLQPKAKALVYEAIVGMGTVLVGKLVTRELVAHLIKRAGMKVMLKYTAKIVPVAGQFTSAALGFAAFQVIGYQHVEACAKVAHELLSLGQISSDSEQPGSGYTPTHVRAGDDSI